MQSVNAEGVEFEVILVPELSGKIRPKYRGVVEDLVF